MAAEGIDCAACHAVTDEERLAQLDDVLRQYRTVPGALIPVLQITQAIFGYLPDVALRKISTALRKSYSEVAGVVGFYSFFTTVPRGRHMMSRLLGHRLLRARRQGGPGGVEARPCASRWARRLPISCFRSTWAGVSAPADWLR